MSRYKQFSLPCNFPKRMRCHMTLKAKSADTIAFNWAHPGYCISSAVFCLSALPISPLKKCLVCLNQCSNTVEIQQDHGNSYKRKNLMGLTYSFNNK